MSLQTRRESDKFAVLCYGYNVDCWCTMTAQHKQRQIEHQPENSSGNECEFLQNIHNI